VNLRCLKFVLIVSLVLGTFAGTADAVEDWRQEECRLNTGSPEWTTWNVKQTIRCAVSHWPVPGGFSKAVAVASCESGSDLLDRSNDGVAGTFQQAVPYWPERRSTAVRATGWVLQPSVYNPRPNVVVSIRMAHALGWDEHWPGCS